LLAFGLQVRLSMAPRRQKTAAHLPPEPPAVTPPPPPDTMATPPPPPDTIASAPPSPDTTAAMPSYYDSLGISYDEAVLIEQPLIFGAVDEVAISQVGQSHLDKVAAILMKHPKIRLSLVGHICNSETETEDPKVAAARVKAVVHHLISKGVRRNRMDVSSLKESDPVQPNNPPANYRKRRVAITIE
jgi:outer membrane protein OmpA-like peptidoglycan-associated protein